MRSQVVYPSTFFTSILCPGVYQHLHHGGVLVGPLAAAHQRRPAVLVERFQVGTDVNSRFHLGRVGLCNKLEESSRTTSVLAAAIR